MGAHEQRQADRVKLYELLMIEKLNKGSDVKGLKETISRTVAGMDQDDVKIVKQEINEFFESQ